MMKRYILLRAAFTGREEIAPGKICRSFEALMQALEHKDYEFEKVEAFVKTISIISTATLRTGNRLASSRTNARRIQKAPKLIAAS